MSKYIIRRLIGLIPTLFIVITISFFIIRVAPGGPFDSERRPPKHVLENIQEKFHLNDPVYVQYLKYLGDVVQGDLGPSFRYQDHDVNFYIAQSLPNSLLLGFVALGIAIILGVNAGVISSLNQNTWIDYLAMAIAVIGITVPLFVIGPVLMYFLALQWDLLPTSGWITGRYGWVTIIMPAVTLSLRPFATIARLSRASMLEILRSDFIRTAKAKGLKDSVIVYSVILIVMNFIVDIIYSFLDPRITYK